MALDASSYPSVATLVDQRAASRVHAKDATLYDFSAEAQACAENFMGWADLACNPPYPPQAVQELADSIIDQGIRSAVLIGQGGSTQAPMTITKFNRPNGSRVDFFVIDSDSPVRLRKTLGKVDPASTVFIVSSKSGGTLEPRMMLAAVRKAVVESGALSEAEMPRHLVAVTDPGSNLEKQATEEGWLAILPGEPTVGGRFSALSVFGLLPAALVGIDLESMMARAKEAELACAADSPENPAVQLAAFLYDNYTRGRDKFSFLTPRRSRVLALWIEQLVAESLGKNGKGILPNFEADPRLLAADPGDRTIVTCGVENDATGSGAEFDEALKAVCPDIPRMDFAIETTEDLVAHLITWEYATALAGYLMQVCPFDQPDVAVAKAKVLDILRDGQPQPSFVDAGVEVRVSPALAAAGATDVRGVLKALVEGIEPGDYFAIDAFLPFTGEGRREALEAMRADVARARGVAACLEIGPRYLHSVGQLQKGGPNNGVFLVLSGEEAEDFQLGLTAESLGTLAKAQAVGDWSVLAERGRRAVSLHLASNEGAELARLEAVLREVLAE